MGSLGRILRRIQRVVVFITLICTILMGICSFAVIFGYANEPYSLLIGIGMLIFTACAAVMTVTMWKKNNYDLKELDKDKKSDE